MYTYAYFRHTVKYSRRKVKLNIARIIDSLHFTPNAYSTKIFFLFTLRHEKLIEVHNEKFIVNSQSFILHCSRTLNALVFRYFNVTSTDARTRNALLFPTNNVGLYLYIWHFASPATDLTVLPSMGYDAMMRYVPRRRGGWGGSFGSKHRCVHGQDVLSGERVSAAAGHGYHTITRRRRWMWRYRWRAPAVAVRLLRRYLQRAIVERRRRRMLTFPVSSQIDLPLERLVA